jgi:Zn ribbon nucleic-acid-binding protein
VDIPASRFLAAACPQCGAEGNFFFHWDDEEVPAVCPECDHRFEVPVPVRPAATEAAPPES